MPFTHGSGHQSTSPTPSASSFTTAYDPANLVASSSSSPPNILPRLLEPQLAALTLVTETPSPPFTDLHTMSPATISSPTPTNNRRSPPPPVSPPAIPPVSNTRGTNAPPASDRGSLDYPIAQPDSPPLESPRVAILAEEHILWMPPGNMHHTRSIAYATITLTQDAGATNPSFFIRAAISSMPNVVAVHFSLFPSSHGCMGLLFDSPVEHEAVVYFTSINLREGSL